MVLLRRLRAVFDGEVEPGSDLVFGARVGRALLVAGDLDDAFFEEGELIWCEVFEGESVGSCLGCGVPGGDGLGSKAGLGYLSPDLGDVALLVFGEFVGAVAALALDEDARPLP